MLTVGEVMHVWGEEVCGNFVLSTQSCYEPKIAFKNYKVFLNHGLLL